MNEVVWRKNVMRAGVVRRANSATVKLALAVAIAVPMATSALAQSPASQKAPPGKSAGKLPRTADGHPDFNGTWSNASIIALERPKELEGKQTLTLEEMAAYEKVVFARSSRERPRPGGGVGTYNDFWWDSDSKRAPNLRTSIIVDPPDGKVPPLTPAAQQTLQVDRAHAREHPADGPEDRGLLERCILFPTTGPPMLPSFYNNSQFGPLTTYYQIVQTPDHVTILIELNHDVRIIPLDGRPHAPSKVRQWLGDPRGHWEGDALVVDTTNFTGNTKFKGADENLHLTERFTRTGPDTILYAFTVDDPTAFTKPWKGEIPMALSNSPLFEHACNEGNYGLAGILSGARANEQKVAK
jgi:hypothetical protein